LHEAPRLSQAAVYAAGSLSNLIFAALLWIVIIYHRSVVPFMSDTEALFGLPRFLLLLSIALAFFNLIPMPPLDGGQLLFLVLESLGKAVPNEQQLIRIGSWMIAVTTIIVALLLASRVLNDTP
jgi:membrane-associated protease RseP (regulator of RpoE activity)